jgi:hypothetical protein
MFTPKQKAASIRNWRRAQTLGTYWFIIRMGDTLLAAYVRDILFERIEKQWTKDKEAIAKNPNYIVPGA